MRIARARWLAATVVGLLIAALSSGPAIGRASAAPRHDQLRIELSLPDYLMVVNATSCPTASVCFAGGQDEVGDFAVAASTDGGQTWRGQSLPYRSAGAVTGISCPTPLNCWAVGTFAAPGPPTVGLTPLFRTSDGGQTWTTQVSPLGAMTGVSCSTLLDCWVVGANFGRSAAGAIAATTDGGQTWATQGFGSYPDTIVSLTGVSCPTASDCWAVGHYDFNSLRGIIIATSDGGQHWVQQDTGEALVELTSISCATVTHCAAVGDTAWATITSDGGNSWSSNPLPFDTAVLTGVSCPTSDNCWAVGAAGSFFARGAVILASTDGGMNWQPQQSLPTGMNAATVSCGSATQCLAAGEVTNSSSGLVAAAAWATADGGSVWNSLTLPTSPITSLDAVSCPTGRDCWAVGQTPTGGGAILATANGGKAWKAQELPSGISDLTSVYCLSAKDCWAGSSAGQIVATTNGGRTWAAQPTPPVIGRVAGISCPNSSDCQAVTNPVWGGVGVVIATVNGGTSWTYEAQPLVISPSAISCPTVEDCWIVSGAFPPGIDATHNGGAAWSSESLPASLGGVSVYFTAVSCPSAMDCLVSGTEFTSTGTAGVVLATGDGGSTWTQQPAPTGVATLTGVSCPTSSRCQATGLDETNVGAVLTTTTGGFTWEQQASSPQLGELAGVSCPRAGRCQMVGQTTAGGPAIAS